MSKYEEQLGLAAKVAAGCAGLIYVQGVFVCAIGLGRYGLYNLPLFEPLYFMVGAWASLPLVVAGFFMTSAVAIQNGLLSYKATRCIKPARPMSYVLHWAFCSVGAVFGPYFFVLRFVASDAGMQCVAIGLFSYLVCGVTYIIAPKAEPDLHGSYRVPLLLGTGIFTVFLLMAYSGVFAMLLHPKIPTRYGGGLGIEAELILRRDAQEVLGACAPGFWDPNVVVHPVDVLYVTSDAYVLRDRHGFGSVVIDRDDVALVRFLSTVSRRWQEAPDPNSRKP